MGATATGTNGDREMKRILIRTYLALLFLACSISSVHGEYFGLDIWPGCGGKIELFYLDGHSEIVTIIDEPYYVSYKGEIIYLDVIYANRGKGLVIIPKSTIKEFKVVREK